MRCRACDIELTDIEATRKDPDTKEFYDLCGGCMREIRNAKFEEDMDWRQYISLDDDEEML